MSSYWPEVVSCISSTSRWRRWLAGGEREVQCLGRGVGGPAQDLAGGQRELGEVALAAFGEEQLELDERVAKDVEECLRDLPLIVGIARGREIEHGVQMPREVHRPRTLRSGP